ncbi:HPr family phosphocarrier protein [Dongia sp.]|uniref:HPr family phosphocarrier protein n=1 Tax=Dongia sp. TaxID=1977262 RepID=UPI0035B396F2
MSAVGKITGRARIANQKGLHARAAAKFVKTSGAYNADIRVAKGEMDVSGGSIMGLMMLAAGIGSELEIQASGPEAKQAVDALIDLIERKFDEE